MRLRASLFTATALLVTTLMLGPGAARADEFSYLPPGDLVPTSGEGRVDDTVYVPGMRFPIEEGPAYANSQVYGAGGLYGPGGGQCDTVNFSYPWRDNYCETRTWDMPLCPAGEGHQGQDIRAATCTKDVHWAVAAADGTITSIGSYSVYLTAGDGTRFDYLHMDSLQVGVGDDVTRGQRIGKVSNSFGGTSTTTHLHFNIQQFVAGVGTVYVPPYTSLVEGYKALVAPAIGPSKGTLDAADCDGVRGWSWDPGAPGSTDQVVLAFDGPKGSLDASEVTVAADEPRDDLCTAIGSCDHGFSSPLPVSLMDGRDHEVRAYGVNGATGQSAELAESPRTLSCALDLPPSVRREIADYGSFTSWRFSAFWDVATLDDEALGAIDEGAELPLSPPLVASAGGGLWLIDGGVKRAVSEEASVAWRLDAASATVESDAEIASVPDGAPLRARPIVVKSAGAALWLLDDGPAGGSTTVGAGVGGGGEAAHAALSGDASCDCGVAGGGPGERAPGLSFVGALLLLRRRRRR